MAKEKSKGEEMSKEEKAEQIAKRAEYSLKTLKDEAMWAYALPNYADQTPYGEIGKNYAKLGYEQITGKSPSQENWERIFNPLLKNGAITNESLQKSSSQSLIEAVQSIKAEDALKLIGSKEKIDEKYKGTYVFELDEKDQQQIVSLVIQGISSKKILEGSAKLVPTQYTKGLEGILCEQPKDKIISIDSAKQGKIAA
jgi:hypothetical protein